MRHLLLAGLISGLAAGLALTLAQQVWVVPLIVKAEAFEHGAAGRQPPPGEAAPTMASMVRPIPSSKNGRYALAALSYLAVLYGTLGLTPPFFRWLSATLGGAGYSLAITLFLLAMAGLALWNARGRLTGLGPPGAAGLALVAIGYGLIFLWVPAPATRLHTLQYGALSWLVTGALRGRGPVGGPAWRLHAGTLVLVCAAAVGDETIQWFLPNRFGLPADVLVDWLSASLAQAAIFLLRDRARDAAPPAARFWRKFSSQSGSKTF